MDGFLHLPWGYMLTVVTTMGGYLLALILIPRILLDQKRPEVTLVWILTIFFLPYIGAAAYYAIGRPRIKRRARKRKKYYDVIQSSLNQLLHDGDTESDNPNSVEFPEIVRLSTRLTDIPLASGNICDIFISGRQAFENMATTIESAQEHIHLMTYIFRPDATGRYFLDLLTKKARDGLSVRLLVDGFGGYGLRDDFIRPLVEAGGQFARFSPIFSRLTRWRPSLRNHRKILIVDGRIGFTGGLNIGDEYQGRKKRYAPWRDTHLRLEGPAVRYLQEIFTEDWFFATTEDLTDPEHFPFLEPKGKEIVQVIGSGPDENFETIHRIFFTAISEARHSVYITTPYFVPDPPVLMALKVAAWRGVDVRILLPGKSDLPLVRVAGFSYYHELIEAGVKLYEHRPGILHAKTMVVDGVWGTIGSANMDIRSFRMNFEVNVLVWGDVFGRRLVDLFFRDLDRSRLITADRLARKTRRQRLAEGIVRVFSPLL